MRLLFIGDIVGRPGREIVKRWVPEIRRRFQIDWVIGNYENSAHGFGITPKIYEELSPYIDIWTGGNHSFDKREALPLFKKGLLLRPLNYYDGAPGHWFKEVEGLVVINGMGEYGMPCGRNPFRFLLKVLEEREEWRGKFIFIDFHGEATSEKNMLFYLLKGRVGGIIGTHTHVGTDDLQIESGTCYLTDIGLTGCRNGMIGFDPVPAVEGYLTGMKSRLDIPKKCKLIFQGVVIEAVGPNAVKAFKLKGDWKKLEITQQVEG
ncbi:MAG: TIGR00282 family metallophosphoesterase [Campylobacterales bacterium]